MEKFLLICPIGLEKIVANELIDKCQLFNIDAPSLVNQVQGGVEVEMELENGVKLNHILRTPTRILLRIKSQKCRDLPKLFNILKKIPWKDYLQSYNYEFKITAKKSRIIHTAKIEASASKALAQYFQANKVKQSIVDKHKDDPTQSIFLRLFNDELTISLDTTGIPLHIRSEKASHAKAPIRENFAHSLLRQLVTPIKKDAYALIDPMCGSATFIWEGINYNSPIHRSFNYQHLKAFNGLSFQFSENDSLFSEFFAKDINEKLLSNIQDERIKTKIEDVFEASPVTTELPKIVIINPPYGKRIKITGDKKAYFSKLINTIIRVYDPHAFGIIIPKPFVPKIKAHKLYFKQNGIDVCFLSIYKS